MNKELHLHFVGVGGIGMSGIAEVFLNQGYLVSGSDLSEGESTRRLAGLGARIAIGHRAENVRGAQVVVVSSAVKPTNPEVVEARRLRIPVIPRVEVLGELMRGKTGIAVAGTHGKTTTTSMIAMILTHAGVDPTLVIGGKVDHLGGNAKLGQGKLVVAEADESDGSFLRLPATYGVITNIDNDHLDHYETLAAIEDAFVAFVANLPFYGCVAVCVEDPGVKRVIARFTKPFVTYGWKDADYTARAVEQTPTGSRFEVWDGDARLGQITLGVPGKHNVLNALAAISICLRIGTPFAVVAQGLERFTGVKRRFEIRYRDDARRLVVVDDYGHHPTEIAATLEAARAFWKGRVIVLFQPHRYTRTRDCFEGFTLAFKECDAVLVTDIYPAGEEPIDGVSSEHLAAGMRLALSRDVFSSVGALEPAVDALLKQVKDGDLLLCLGAGSITRAPELLIKHLGARARG